MIRPAAPLTLAEKLAKRAYPRRRTAQVHYVRGWNAESGDADALAALVGSEAEQYGMAAAKRAKAAIERIAA